MSTRDKGRLGPFVALLKETLASPAWLAMSHGAKILYVALKARYSSNLHNNGRVFISQRNARREIGSSFNEIARWFRELQHFGFIVQTQGGSLGVDGKGKAPHWRLTECGYMKDLPTRDFMKWDGAPFKDTAQNRRKKKQSPVTENRNTPLRKPVTPSLRKPVTPPGTSVTENRNISDRRTVTENRNINSLTTPRGFSAPDLSSGKYFQPLGLSLQPSLSNPNTDAQSLHYPSTACSKLLNEPEVCVKHTERPTPDKDSLINSDTDKDSSR